MLAYIATSEIIHPANPPESNASVAGTKLDSSTTRIAREERDVQPLSDGSAQVLIHFSRIILIMTDGQKAFGPGQPGRVGMRVEIRDIGHIATPGLEPISQRKFPEKPFA